MAWTAPGPVRDQIPTATAATASSTIMPAAPTRARFQRSRNPQAAVASTYGIGVKSISITPMAWTSPPNRRQQYAWPSSCRAFSPTIVA
jgi:hypothetical protein